MNATSPARWFLTRCTSITRPSLQRHLRPYASTSTPQKRSRRKRRQTLTAADYKPYSKKDLKSAQKLYTPGQLEALEAGEKSIDPKDLASQATLRTDDFAIPYLDDFSRIRPFVDKPVRPPKGQNYDPKQRLKTEDETIEDLANFVENMPEDATRLDYIKFVDNMRLTTGREEAERNPRSTLAPEVPKGLEALKRPGLGIGDAEIDPHVKRLMKQTGYSKEAIQAFRVKVLVFHRVVNQTRMGKIQSMYSLAVAGNGRGLLGIGEGKSSESDDSRRQARHNAIRNMQPIPLYENRTIFGDMKVKFGAVEIELMTRPPGMWGM